MRITNGKMYFWILLFLLTVFVVVSLIYMYNILVFIAIAHPPDPSGEDLFHQWFIKEKQN